MNARGGVKHGFCGPDQLAMCAEGIHVPETMGMNGLCRRGTSSGRFRCHSTPPADSQLAQYAGQRPATRALSRDKSAPGIGLCTGDARSEGTVGNCHQMTAMRPQDTCG